MNEITKLLIDLGITIAAFLIGRYVLPKIKPNVNVQDLTVQFQLLLGYAESFCAYARQFLTQLSGKEKMDTVVEKLKVICDKQGIQVDEETLRAIGQKAYDAMKAGETTSKAAMENAVKELKEIVEPTVKEIITETTGIIIEKITADTTVITTTDPLVVPGVVTPSTVPEPVSNQIVEEAVDTLKPFEGEEPEVVTEDIRYAEPEVDAIKPESII